MTSECRIRILADQIELLLSEGLDVSSKLWDFIENSLGQVTPRRLSDVVSLKDDSDSQTITDLLFFPDESFQAALEPSICSEDFTDTDTFKLAGLLSCRETQTAFIFPAPTDKIPLVMPPHVVPAFIDRLCISRTHPQELLSAATAHLEKHLAIETLVRLRNSRFVYTDFRKVFLVWFFESFARQCHGIADMTRFVLEQLDQMPNDTDVMEFFLVQKQRWLERLKGLRQFELEFTNSNIETLLTQGIQPPSLDPEKLSKNIRMVDRLFTVKSC